MWNRTWNVVTRVLVAAPLALAATESGALAGYWTNYVSEESGYYATCDEGYGAIGFACSGRYCDNVSLLCDEFPSPANAPSWFGYLTGWFSEEHDNTSTWFSTGWYRYDNENYEVCHNTNPTGGVVTGIGCTGRYCDNISLECRQPVNEQTGVKLALTNCAWSGWLSEEQVEVDFGSNRYITGVECSGSNCDNKRFHVCSIAF